MKHLRPILCLLLSIVLLVPLSACGAKAGEDFTVLLSSNVTSLDPQIATGEAADWVIGSIFEGLCRVDEKGKATPGVSDRWDHNRDYTRFTFHLRKTAWSNGTQVTAEDFLFGILRALDPATNPTPPQDLFLIKNAQAYYEGEVTAEEVGITTDGDRKVIFDLEYGYVDFPLLTAGNHYMPCNREYFETCDGHYGQSAAYIVTNGPFTFSSIYAWSTDYGEREIYLVQANDYRGEHTVQPASLTFRIDYEDYYDNDPTYGLSDGSVDLRKMPSETTALSYEAQNGKLLSIENGVTGILLNSDCDALSVLETRRLFLQTIDRAALLEASGKTDCEAQGIMSGVVRYGKKAYYEGETTCFVEQDNTVTETIPSLLEMLKREELPCITLLYPQEENSTDLGEISPETILSQWNNALGGAFNMSGVPADSLASQIADGNYEAAIYTLKPRGATPFAVLSAFSGSASPLLYDDPAFDAALSGCTFSKEDFTQLEEWIRNEYLFYPLVNSKTYYALAPGVTGIELTADGRLNFISARKK